MNYPRISAFADCGSQSVVIRAPYKTAVDMVLSLAHIKEREELLNALFIASRTSKDFSRYLKAGIKEWNTITQNKN